MRAMIRTTICVWDHCVQLNCSLACEHFLPIMFSFLRLKVVCLYVYSSSLKMDLGNRKLWCGVDLSTSVVYLLKAVLIRKFSEQLSINSIACIFDLHTLFND